MILKRAMDVFVGKFTATCINRLHAKHSSTIASCAFGRERGLLELYECEHPIRDWAQDYDPQAQELD